MEVQHVSKTSTIQSSIYNRNNVKKKTDVPKLPHIFYYHIHTAYYNEYNKNNINNHIKPISNKRYIILIMDERTKKILAHNKEDIMRKMLQKNYHFISIYFNKKIVCLFKNLHILSLYLYAGIYWQIICSIMFLLLLIMYSIFLKTNFLFSIFYLTRK